MESGSVGSGRQRIVILRFSEDELYSIRAQLERESNEMAELVAQVEATLSKLATSRPTRQLTASESWIRSELRTV